MSIVALLAVVATLAGPNAVPTCAPNIAAYNAQTGNPAESRYWAGIAGYFNWRTRTLGLSPQTCRDLAALRSGFTWQRGYAAFTLAHELGHASGLLDEGRADCYGAGHASQVAYALGLRGHRAFGLLRRNGSGDWGYETIPKDCFVNAALVGEAVEAAKGKES